MSRKPTEKQGESRVEERAPLLERLGDPSYLAEVEQEVLRHRAYVEEAETLALLHQARVEEAKRLVARHPVRLGDLLLSERASRYLSAAVANGAHNLLENSGIGPMMRSYALALQTASRYLERFEAASFQTVYINLLPQPGSFESDMGIIFFETEHDAQEVDAALERLALKHFPCDSLFDDGYLRLSAHPLLKPEFDRWWADAAKQVIYDVITGGSLGQVRDYETRAWLNDYLQHKLGGVFVSYAFDTRRQIQAAGPARLEAPTNAWQERSALAELPQREVHPERREELKRVEALWANGLYDHEIANELNMSESTVKRRRRELGLVKHRTQKR